MKGQEKVLGCRLTMAEWEDFNRFRADKFPDKSATVALRALLQMALTVTGHLQDLWKDEPQIAEEGWFANLLQAYVDGHSNKQSATVNNKPGRPVRKLKASKPAAKKSNGGGA